MADFIVALIVERSARNHRAITVDGMFGLSFVRTLVSAIMRHKVDGAMVIKRWGMEIERRVSSLNQIL